MTIRHRSAAALTAIVALAATGGEARELTYNSWLPPVEAANAQAMTYFWDKVSEATGGEVTGRMFYAGQMIGQVETLGGIKEGAVDSGFITPSATPQDTPRMAILNEVQAFSPNPLAALGAALETQMIDCESCQQEARDNGIITLGGHVTAPFWLMCTKDLQSAADLEGLRLRALLRFFQEAADTFGMTPVNISFPEMVPSLQRGQVDCIIANDAWLTIFKLDEVMKSIVTNQPFGTFPSTTLITINRDVWNELGEDVQAAMIEAAPYAVASATIAYSEAGPAARAKALEAGVVEVDLGPEFDALYAEFVAGETPSIVETYEAFGVTEAAEIVKMYRENYTKWEGLVADVGSDVDAMADLLRSEIYSKASF